MTKKILLVDDEAVARERTLKLLKNSNPNFVIQEAQDGLLALDKITKFNPDIVFLDIQMPGLTGFQVLQNITNEAREKIEIIFLTVYDEFALKVLEANGCDYLLKPFSQDKFQAALGKALRGSVQIRSLERLELKLMESRKYLEKIIVRSSGSLKIIEASQVLCFVDQDQSTHIYTPKGEFVSELSLERLEENLNPNLFLRLHRDSLVAISQVKSVDQKEVTLHNGMILEVSRNSRKELLKRL
jgi:two-component system LytT family response regulator